MQKRLLLKTCLLVLGENLEGKKNSKIVNKMRWTCLTLIKFFLYVYGVYVYRLEMFDKAGVYVQRFFKTVERSTSAKSDPLLKHSCMKEKFL